MYTCTIKELRKGKLFVLLGAICLLCLAVAGVKLSMEALREIRCRSSKPWQGKFPSGQDWAAQNQWNCPQPRLHCDLTKYNYTTEWFAVSEFRKNIHKFLNKGQQRDVLEVGTFEGIGSSCISDYLLDHPNSTLDIVDPFLPGDPTTPQISGSTESIARGNIARSAHASKIKIYKMFSTDYFKQLQAPDGMPLKRYDLIYMDGSHVPEDVKVDLEGCFQLLKPGGILWMDDYNWNFKGIGAIKRAIESVLRTKLAGKHTVIHKGYQIAISRRLLKSPASQ